MCEYYTVTMPTAIDGFCRNKVPRGRSWEEARMPSCVDCGQSMNGVPIAMPKAEGEGWDGRFHLAVVWFVQNCCMSGANNSEQYSTLEIVAVPCTNQALLDWLALLLPPHCVCASTVQLTVQRSDSSRLPLSGSAWVPCNSLLWHTNAMYDSISGKEH